MNEERFKGFTKKEIPNTKVSSEVMIHSISAERRDQVDEMVNKAVSLGAKVLGEPQDPGFMYIWGFQDLDGHLWEIAFLDESALNQE